MATELVETVRIALKEVAAPEKAPEMQAYMKSTMPYLGVSATALRQVCKRVFAGLSLPTAAAWRRAALSLWRGARFREERYAAVELTGLPRARPFQTLETLPMYEELIVTGAWWDYVDVIAKHRLGPLLAAYPGPMHETMLAWSRDADMWKRRASILCQLDFKERTDLELLYTCLEPSMGSSEFFLRKAIGWALRQYAWTDPREVKRYVKQNATRLSPLSKREALKHCGAELSAGRGSRSRPPRSARPARP